MRHRIEPAEIDQYDFPWQAPLVAIDERDACIKPSYHPKKQVEPDDLSVVERRLFEANPRDFEWISDRIKDLPDYLTKYFVRRYVDLCEKGGYQKANTYLRTKVAPASERALMVLEKYKLLPTSQKVALLSKEFGEGDDPFHPAFFTEQREPEYLKPEQGSFDFGEVKASHKPVKNRLLAELEKSELKEMAFKLSCIVVKFQTRLTEDTDCDTPEGEGFAALILYRQTAELIQGFGIKPPGAGKKLSPENVFQHISKTRCEKWWLRCLVKARKIMREHLAIAMGQVSSKASPYASWDCVREHQEQQTQNWQAIQNMMLFDEETEEQTELKDMVLKSVSNPAIRRHELMTRCRGCENIGNELGLQGLFLTLTTPSEFHNSYKKGGFIDHWNGASPREAQSYLNNVWQRIRAKLGRLGLRWFGVRVAEPHHDGTPHWHLLLWVKPQDVLRITDVFIRYAVMRDCKELLPKEKWAPVAPFNYVQPIAKNPFKVYKKVYENNFPVKPMTRRPRVELPESVQVWPIKQEGLTTLNLDYTPRCDVGFIDPEQGTATGYIAKYISKNIDGYAMDDEVSDETGKSVKAMAKNVSAWKSRWNIRQFQFFGGAPVTTYRELRRFASQNKKAFMEYLFMQERVDLLTIYSMLQRDLVGPIKPSKLITNKELMQVIGDSYQARGDSKQSRIAGTLAAADHGNWKGYIMGQGGPFVKRDDLLIVNSYQVLPFASPHGEDVRKIEGFTTPEETVKTRTKVWTIIKKSKVNEDAEACTQGSDATAIGAFGSSRSSVNNCTEPEKVQVCDQLTRLLDPRSSQSKEDKRANKSPNIDEAALAALLKGSSIRIDDATSIQIRPAEIDEHGKKRPAQLVEVSRQRSDDTNWMDFEGWDNLFAQPEKQEYQQPDLSIFPDGDDWPLM
ncbi:replication endonuclease [Vibrio neptunius]|uniref:Replication endonuclease n=1 Tax=Vibrio neptunius TaxID=170651 RepID=A0ABS2ZYK0_9VIBR|nr:replication endonuclease [Vibrio neptunius]MBN3492047.1 replication endonuclease [Vibrio neptunius]MBN3514544.1 replication endonuclease [Vibrio neptunius]MBN3549330.1 replication endonuclease [Vibrio neptunius]MBN3576855.1 replication endonuclease [Vibrio neptunius]MCH9870519.1 replication endonuclease [Vibrio neptunius]